MPGRRPLIVFATAFVGVLVAGVAFAQVGAFAPDEPIEPPAATEQVVETATEDEPPHLSAENAEAEPADGHDEVRESVAPVEGDRKEEPVGDATDQPKEEHRDEPVDTTPPEFVILHPTDNQRFEVEKVAFEGEVEPGARVFAGDWEADVNAKGQWRIVLILNEGQNVTTLTAVDAAGNVSTDTVTVHYDAPAAGPKTDAPRKEKPPEPEPAEEPPNTEPVDEVGEGDKPAPAEEGHPKEEPPVEEGGDVTDEPASVAFTAHQQFGTCAEELPYDVFWGTANPGSTVYVVSDFGSGSTTANAAGDWEIRVDFPTAPFDDVFNVVVETDGGRKVFSFVRVSGEG